MPPSLEHISLLRITAGIALALALGACQDPSAEPPSATGAELYANYCAVCHGTDGQMALGVTNPVTISHPDFLSVVDDQFLFDSIAQGRPGVNGRGRPGTKMSAFGLDDGRVLSDDEIWRIVAYVREWQTTESVTLEPFDASGGDPAAGALTYAEHCADCHGADGWGDKGPRLAGDTLQQTASDAYLRHSVLVGRAGTDMQAFAFDDGQIADLLAFVRSLGPAGGAIQ